MNATDFGLLIVAFISLFVGAYGLGFGPAYLLKRFKEFTDWKP